MRENRDIFLGKSIDNRETISRQEHRISEYSEYRLVNTVNTEYRIKILSNDSIGFRYYGSK